MLRTHVGRTLVAAVLMLTVLSGIGQAAAPQPKTVAGVASLSSGRLHEFNCDLDVYFPSGTGGAVFFGALEGHNMLADAYLPGYFCGKQQGNIAAYDVTVAFIKDAHLTALGVCYFGGTWSVSPGPLPGMARITLTLNANECDTYPPFFGYRNPGVHAKFLIKTSPTSATGYVAVY